MTWESRGDSPEIRFGSEALTGLAKIPRQIAHVNDSVTLLRDTTSAAIAHICYVQLTTKRKAAPPPASHFSSSLLLLEPR